jgi:hypothetical protein
MNTWLLLTATLPTHPSALRVRVWRALKATGAGTLREGVYLLPSGAPAAQALWDIEKLIHDSGADAHMLEVSARDSAQEAAFRALFDRGDLYAELLQSIKEARKQIKAASEAGLHKTLRGLEQQLQSIQASDFFPGKASDKTGAALAALRQEVVQQLSPGEPSASAEVIQRLALSDFQGKTWATRKRPWVDRLATAWLVTRFIDQAPRFVWQDDPRKCPKTALGFDFDGARFSHVGELVTFEVVARSFGLDTDPGLQRLGQLVHYIDVGGIPVDEAAGIETLVRGLQAQHPKDDTLLAAALPLFDALYAALAARP